MLVVIVLLVFLGNLRAALIVAAVIPLSMMFGFVGMVIAGISANLMSLGAIDFGMVVDGAVVMMENSMRRLAHDKGQTSWMSSARRRTKSLVRSFAVAIIIAVYLPILTLEGLEGRMFRPMAITVCSLLIGSLILALTVVPVLATLRCAGEWSKKRRAGLLGSGQHTAVRSSQSFEIELWFPQVLRLVLVSVASLAWIGTEFMPRLDEGSF